MKDPRCKRCGCGFDICPGEGFDATFARIVGKGKDAKAEFLWKTYLEVPFLERDTFQLDLFDLKCKLDSVDVFGANRVEYEKALEALKAEHDKYCDKCGGVKGDFLEHASFVKVVKRREDTIAEFVTGSCDAAASKHVGEIFSMGSLGLWSASKSFPNSGEFDKALEAIKAEINRDDGGKGLTGVTIYRFEHGAALEKAINSSCSVCGGKKTKESKLFFKEIVGRGKDAKVEFVFRYCDGMLHAGDLFYLNMQELKLTLNFYRNKGMDTTEILKAIEALEAEIYSSTCDKCGGEKKNGSETTFVKIVGKGKDAKAELAWRYCSESAFPHHAGETVFIVGMNQLKLVANLEGDTGDVKGELEAIEALEAEYDKYCECGGVKGSTELEFVRVVGHGKKASARMAFKYCNSNKAFHAGQALVFLCLDTLKERAKNIKKGGGDNSGELEAIKALQAEHNKYCDQCGGEKKDSSKLVFVEVVGEGKKAYARFRRKYCGRHVHVTDTISFQLGYLKCLGGEFGSSPLSKDGSEESKGIAALEAEHAKYCNECGGMRSDVVDRTSSDVEFVKIFGPRGAVRAEFKWRYCDDMHHHAGDPLILTIHSLRDRLKNTKNLELDYSEEAKALKEFEAVIDSYCVCGGRKGLALDYKFLSIVDKGSRNAKAQFEWMYCHPAYHHAGDTFDVSLVELENKLAWRKKCGQDTAEDVVAFEALLFEVERYCDDCGGERRAGAETTLARIIGKGKEAKAELVWKYCGGIYHAGQFAFTNGLDELRAMVRMIGDTGNCTGELEAIKALQAEHNKYCNHCGGEIRKFAEATFVEVVGKGKTAKAKFVWDHCVGITHKGETFSLTLDHLKNMVEVGRDFNDDSPEELEAIKALQAEHNKYCDKCGAEKLETPRSKFKRIVGKGKRAKAELILSCCCEDKSITLVKGVKDLKAWIELCEGPERADAIAALKFLREAKKKKPAAKKKKAAAKKKK